MQSSNAGHESCRAVQGLKSANEDQHATALYLHCLTIIRALACIACTVETCYHDASSWPPYGHKKHAQLGDIGILAKLDYNIGSSYNYYCTCKWSWFLLVVGQQRSMPSTAKLHFATAQLCHHAATAHTQMHCCTAQQG